MKQFNSAARDISYASSAETKAGRAFIRTVENMTGRVGLIKRAAGYGDEVAAGRDFWNVMMERYNVRLNFLEGTLDRIPKEGPVVVVANHPFGILDGLVLGHILSEVRGDFRILAHRVFRNAEDLDRVILPINFDKTKEAVKVNLNTRKVAIDYLKDGGCIGIFPGGTVSTAATPMSYPMDPQWRNFTAKLIQKSGATVVPVYFDGTNSRLFQFASHTHYTLRMAMLIREFKKNIRKNITLSIGNPILSSEILPFSKDYSAMMRFLRDKTYGLSSKNLDTSDLGFEFEDNYKNASRGFR